VNEQTLHIIPHTHWDREWYEPFETFRLRLIRVMDKVLKLLDTVPTYRFMLDGQTAMLDDYLAVRPERGEDIRRYAKAGRLDIGPWTTLPDEFLASGETLVRNLAHGRKRAEDFHRPMNVAYLPDMFGHIAQMPQILQLFGFSRAVVWRGVPSDVTRTIFAWYGLDGAKVRTAYLCASYSNGAELPSDADRLHARGRELWQEQAEFSPPGHLLIMNGTDHWPPQTGLDTNMAMANKVAEAHKDPLRFEFSSLERFFDAADGVLAHTPLPICQGEMRSGWRANVLMGVTSTRTDLKRLQSETEHLLERYCEPLSIVTGHTLSQPLLEAAWERLILNSAHDSICACSSDETMSGVELRYREAKIIAQGLFDEAIEKLTARAHDPRHMTLPPPAWTCAQIPPHAGEDTTGNLPDPEPYRRHSIMVWNPSLRQRSSFVETELPIGDILPGYTLETPDGTRIPCQETARSAPIVFDEIWPGEQAGDLLELIRRRDLHSISAGLRTNPGKNQPSLWINTVAVFPDTPPPAGTPPTDQAQTEQPAVGPEASGKAQRPGRRKVWKKGPHSPEKSSGKTTGKTIPKTGEDAASTLSQTTSADTVALDFPSAASASSKTEASQENPATHWVNARIVLGTAPVMRGHLDMGAVEEHILALAAQPGCCLQVTAVQPAVATVQFRAPEIPPLGWVCLTPVPTSEASIVPLPFAPVSVSKKGTVLDNGLIRVETNPADGTFSLIGADGTHVKGMGRIEDGGDAGDTYNYSPPAQDRTVSRPREVRIDTVDVTALRATLRIQRRFELPARLTANETARSKTTVSFTLTTFVTVTAGTSTVSLAIDFSNTVRDHRLRMLFSLPNPVDCSWAGTTYGVVSRPLETEGSSQEAPLSTWPARDFIDCAGQRTQVKASPASVSSAQKNPDTASTENMLSSPNSDADTSALSAPAMDLAAPAKPDTTGLAVLLNQITEYEVVNEGQDLAITLVRATGFLARPAPTLRPNPAGPNLAVEHAQSQGPQHFRCGLRLHRGDWREARIPVAADAFSHPFCTQAKPATNTPPADPLPPTGTPLFLETSEKTGDETVDKTGLFTLSTFTRTQNTLDLRVTSFSQTDLIFHAQLDTGTAAANSVAPSPAKVDLRGQFVPTPRGSRGTSSEKTLILHPWEILTARFW